MCPRLLKVRSRSGPCYVFWAGVWSNPTCWQQLQTLGETSFRHTGSRSGYLVLTDGQQTHQVPVKVHQEAALEMHSHIDNPYNKWTLKWPWAWTFTSAVFLYETYVTKKQENDIWYIICSLLGNVCYNGDFFFYWKQMCAYYNILPIILVKSITHTSPINNLKIFLKKISVISNIDKKD